ncbi:MAG: hypothetical protein ACRDEA_10455 [Microcystaceae cyanobacterium]
MSNQHSFFNCTSSDFEKAALNRFRSLVFFLPSTCKIFREPWDCSTVLCLDFANCPSSLEMAREQTHLLVYAMQELGLANAVIFRMGHKFIGWKTITPSK